MTGNLLSAASAVDAVYIAPQLKRAEPRYQIIGSGTLKPELTEMMKNLCVEEAMTFLDNVSDQRLVTELDEARCFLLPCVVAESGNRDGIPVTLMEAMAMETPPVSTTVSGIPELVENDISGLLTEPRDPDATANALISLLENDSKRTRCARRAREKVTADFNIEKEADKLESTFRKAQARSE